MRISVPCELYHHYQILVILCNLSNRIVSIKVYELCTFVRRHHLLLCIPEPEREIYGFIMKVHREKSSQVINDG